MNRKKTLNLENKKIEMKSYTRLFDIIYYQNEHYPQKKCITTKYDTEWKSLSTQEVIQKVNHLSRSLIHLGLKAGDKVGIISSNNRTEWNIVDLACQQIGVIDVPIYPTISPKEYAYIFNDAELKIVFVSDEKIVEKVNAIFSEIPTLKKMYSFDSIENTTNWQTLFEDEHLNHQPEVEQRKEQVHANDLATLIYTSGTTGNPKGVMLSHNNIVSNVKATTLELPLEAGHVCMSFLPLCHVFERMVMYSYMSKGTEIHYAESIEKIGDNLKEIRPHFFTTVPRLLEKVYDKIVNTGHSLTGAKKQLFFWALNLGLKYNWRENQGFLYNQQLKLANKLIFSKWREALGGRIQGIVSGSAPLQERLCRVFSAANIPVREGYGLTETSPVLTYNRFEADNAMLGTVGIPLNNVELKIADDGEILVKAPNVMMGYYKQPEKTAKEFTNDGFFKTGDIGELIDGKFLKITDRKKQLMKTSGGKYVAPQPIEEKFKESMLIEQMIVIAEGEKFVSALIVPSKEHLTNWCQLHNISTSCSFDELICKQKVLEKFEETVIEFNKHFSHIEQIKKYTLLPNEFTIEAGELTPTMKLKRKTIVKQYKKEIDKIYCR